MDNNCHIPDLVPALSKYKIVYTYSTKLYVKNRHIDKAY